MTGPVQREAPLLAVLLVVVAGLVVVTRPTGSGTAWRPGLFVIAGGLALATLLRLLLPTHRAGLLASRSRGIDVVTLGALATAVGVLATVIPATGPLD